MVKIAYVKNDRMNEYEITNERASYRTIVNDLIGDIVLCNNICSIDERIYDYMDWDIDEHEIYQFFLCNVNEWNIEKAKACGLLLTYSDLLDCDVMGRGYSWLDTGTMDSLTEASMFVQMIQKRQSIVISAPEEIAFMNGWISETELLKSAEKYAKSPYGQHLMNVANRKIRY